MAPLCCPRCRLLQDDRVCVDCGEPTLPFDGLTRPQIAGLAIAPRPPADGWRDLAALFATAFGAIGVAAAAVAITGSVAGVLLTPAVGIFGYRKQFWKAVFRRRPRLAAVPPRQRPAGDPVTGVAQPFERTVTGGALAIAKTIENADGVIVRMIEAAPFWIVLPDRRVLVAGACWLASVGPAPASRLASYEVEIEGLQLGRASKRRLRISRVAIAPGDRVAVVGRLREEQLAGAGGYRDALTETIRGEPGAVVWIDRLDPPPGTLSDLPPASAPPP